MNPTNAQCLSAMEWAIDEGVDFSEVTSIEEAYDMVWSLAYDGLKEQFGRQCSMKNMDFTDQQQNNLRKRIMEYTNLQ